MAANLARRLERALPVAPALDEHPREVVLVEWRKAAGRALPRVRDRVRRGEFPQVHVLVRCEDQGKPEGRVLLRGTPEVVDGAREFELYHPV